MALKPQRLRIFIGCEGASERSYVRWLQEIAEFHGLSLHFDPQIAGDGDPLAVVEESVVALKKRERVHGSFAKKAILLDKDKIGQSKGRDQKIGGIVQRNGLVLLFQEWEHEALLLRHYAASKNHRPPRGGALQLLRGHWPKYAKPADALELRREFSPGHLDVAMSVEPELRAFLEALGF